MKYLALILTMLVIFGCARITDGEVYEKKVILAHTEMILIPIIISSGKSTTTVLVPYWFWYPEQYRVCIRKVDKNTGDYDTRSIYLTKEKFNTVTNGDWYEITESDSFELVRFKTNTKRPIN